MGLAAGSTASNRQDAVANVMEQVSVLPLKHRVLLAADGVALTVPSVTVPAVALLNEAEPMPLLMTTVSPPTQPAGDSCTVTLPGNKVVQAAFRQALIVTVSGVQTEPLPSCSIWIWS